MIEKPQIAHTSYDESHEQSEKNQDWSTLETEQIVNKLTSLLEERLKLSEDTSSEYVQKRIAQLREAISTLPDKLNKVLPALHENLSEIGVVSYDIYIAGGFAREAAAMRTDKDTEVDTSVRKDTDIDIQFAYTPRDSVTLSKGKVRFELAQALRVLNEDEHVRTGAVEFGFENTATPSWQADKPKILLRHIEIKQKHD